MNRRKALGLLGAATVLATLDGPNRLVHAATLTTTAASQHIVIVGGGILGASLAYHLTQRGAKVTLLEKSHPSSGATGDSFAYLNASTKPEHAYYDLNLAGIAGWRRLQLECDGSLPLQWGGAVYWQDEPAAAAKMLDSLHHYQQWGYAGHQIDSTELQRLLPGVTPGPISAAVYFDQEGTLDPVAAVQILLARAQAAGALVRYPAEVTGFDLTGDRIHSVKTQAGDIHADTVILAAGLGSTALARLAGAQLPLTSSAGVLVHTTPQPRLLNRVVHASSSTIKQNPDGRIVSGSGHEGSDVNASPREQGEQILKVAARYFPQLKQASVENVTVGQRVLPPDGFPIVGYLRGLRNLYVTTTHSGVTLAPILGQYATQEILDGISLEPLSPYRPDRLGPT
jgi:glycine/D-amino acid oxidase-like deaminating enzyme